MTCGIIFLLVKILFKLSGLGIFGYGCYLMYITFKADEKSKKASQWPTAVGTLTESKIVTSYSGSSSSFDSPSSFNDSTPSSSLHIAYTYVVNDETYESSRVSVWPVTGNTYKTSSGLNLLNIDIGQHITVYYQPDDPTFSVLDPQNRSGFTPSLIVSLALIFFGGFFLNIF